MTSQTYSKTQLDALLAGKAATSAIPAVPTLAAVATTGAYSDLTGTPAIPASPADIGAEPAGTAAAAITALTAGASTALDTLAEIDTQLAADEGSAAALATLVGTKAPLASPAFTGTPTGITKAHVGLPNVDNTADTAKPVSTAQQAALDTKANTSALAPVATSGVYSDLSGKPTIPTAYTDLQAAVAARKATNLVGSSRIKTMAFGSTSDAAPTMTTPPTVTQTTAVLGGLTTTINANNGWLRWSTTLQTSFKSGAWTPAGQTIGTTGGLQQARYAQISFDFTGRYLDLDYRYYTTLKYRLWVNEQANTAALTAPAATTNDSRQYLHFDFGTASQGEPRRIILELEDPSNALSVYGFHVAPTELFTPPSIASPRVFWIGDSYGRGYAYGGGSLEANAFARTMGRLLGWADLWNTSVSWGGQGLVHAADQNGNYISRFGYDVAPNPHDLAILQGSVNDAVEDPAAVTAAAITYVNTYRSAFPNNPIIITGPLYVATPTTAHLAVNTAMASAASTLGLPFIDMMTAAVFTGTGAVGGATGDGNADWARNGVDFTHPTPAGANALARFMAGQLARVLKIPV